MSTRAFRGKGQSLIDHITPENELISLHATESGLRFEFRDKVLPPWFAKLAQRLDFAMQDNAPGRLHGRVVSIIAKRPQNRKPRS